MRVCVHVHGCRRVLTLNACALLQKSTAVQKGTRRNRPWARSAFLVHLAPRCLPETQPELYLSSRKQILSVQLFCFTSATVHLPGSRSLLFLHVPDIIIAVRGMIICLLWKLADCLSPVPEELPLKGVPLEKHRKSGFSHAQTHKGANRTARDGGVDAAKEGWRERKRLYCYNIYKNWLESLCSAEWGH